MLSPYGVELCEQLKIDLDEIHHVIYVSPFRRTLLTACHILKMHKKKDKLKLVLEPLIREQMLHSNTMLLRGEALRKMCNELSSVFGLQIDCSFLDAFVD